MLLLSPCVEKQASYDFYIKKISLLKLSKNDLYIDEQHCQNSLKLNKGHEDMVLIYQNVTVDLFVYHLADRNCNRKLK